MDELLTCAGYTLSQSALRALTRFVLAPNHFPANSPARAGENGDISVASALQREVQVVFNREAKSWKCLTGLARLANDRARARCRNAVASFNCQGSTLNTRSHIKCQASGER